MILSDRIRKLMEIQIVIEYCEDTTTEKHQALIKERNELIRGFPRFLD